VVAHEVVISPPANRAVGHQRDGVGVRPKQGVWQPNRDTLAAAGLAFGGEADILEVEGSGRRYDFAVNVTTTSTFRIVPLVPS
jgi:hypothetical protein